MAKEPLTARSRKWLNANVTFDGVSQSYVIRYKTATYYPPRRSKANRPQKVQISMPHVDGTTVKLGDAHEWWTRGAHVRKNPEVEHPVYNVFTVNGHRVILQQKTHGGHAKDYHAVIMRGSQVVDEGELQAASMHVAEAVMRQHVQTQVHANPGRMSLRSEKRSSSTPRPLAQPFEVRLEGKVFKKFASLEAARRYLDALPPMRGEYDRVRGAHPIPHISERYFESANDERRGAWTWRSRTPVWDGAKRNPLPKNPKHESSLALATAFEKAYPKMGSWVFSYEYPGYFVYTKGSKQVYFTPDWEGAQGYVVMQTFDSHGSLLKESFVKYSAPLTPAKLARIVHPYLKSH